MQFLYREGKGANKGMGKRGVTLNRIQNSAGFGFKRNVVFFCFVFISTSNGSIHLPA